jgi:hypothetical protein
MVVELVGKDGHFAVVGSGVVVTPEAEVLVPDALIVETDVAMTTGQYPFSASRIRPLLARRILPKL